MNEYIQWKTDPANQHDPNNGEAWLQAFIEKREDSQPVLHAARSESPTP